MSIFDRAEKIRNQKFESPKYELKPFIIEKNEYLRQDIQAFYRVDYLGYQQPNNPDYINTLKNTYGSASDWELKVAVDELERHLTSEFTTILEEFPKGSEVAICVVPRAKSDVFYNESQLLFREVIKRKTEEKQSRNTGAGVFGGVSSIQREVIDGSAFIMRHTSTKTTHLPRNIKNYDNSGDEPYKGIANDTCTFSDKIKGKHILLVDDVYTKTVNIDEDFIQALLDRGCESVIFFAIARTKRKNQASSIFDKARIKRESQTSSPFANNFWNDSFSDDIP